MTESLAMYWQALGLQVARPSAWRYGILLGSAGALLTLLMVLPAEYALANGREALREPLRRQQAEGVRVALSLVQLRAELMLHGEERPPAETGDIPCPTLPGQLPATALKAWQKIPDSATWSATLNMPYDDALRLLTRLAPCPLTIRDLRMEGREDGITLEMRLAEAA